jgi:hypothetical protein
MEKRRRLVAVLDTSACEVARRAEGAGGATESTWEMVSHEGTKTRRMGDEEEILDVEKRRRLVAVLDTSKARWPEGPKARAARLSQRSRR